MGVRSHTYNLQDRLPPLLDAILESVVHARHHVSTKILRKKHVRDHVAALGLGMFRYYRLADQ